MRKGVGAAVLGFLMLASLLAARAGAAQEELLEQARKLIVDAKPLIEAANDIEQKMEDRKKPRKDAYLKLKQARDLYDKYLDANPSMEEKIDKEYTDCFSMLYWLKKDSSLNELENETPAPELPATPGSSGQGGASGSTPGTGPPAGGPSAPPGPPKSETPSEFAFRAKKQFEAILDFEKKHPGDLPLVKQYLERFLAEFSDLSLPEYAKAIEKVGQLNDRLNNALKEIAKRDPDTIANKESKSESAIFGKLTSDFNSKDMETRRRGARLLAASRARSATYFLARGLADKDEEFAKICRDGLIAIGGTNVGDNLVKLYRDASKEKQLAAMDVLSEITKKGPVDSKAVSTWIGHYVLSNVSEIAESAIALLRKMGRPGGPGLMFGLDSIYPEKKIDVMRAMTEVRYYACAGELADRYLGGKIPPALRNAAMEAIEKLGPRTVPYVIPYLAGTWVPSVMRRVTGVDNIGLGDRKKLKAWWDEHKAEYPDEP